MALPPPPPAVFSLGVTGGDDAAKAHGLNHSAGKRGVMKSPKRINIRALKHVLDVEEVVMDADNTLEDDWELWQVPAR